MLLSSDLTLHYEHASKGESNQLDLKLSKDKRGSTEQEGRRWLSSLPVSSSAQVNQPAAAQSASLGRSASGGSVKTTA